MATNKTERLSDLSSCDDYEATVSRILQCDETEYLRILGLDQPLTDGDAYRAWDSLSKYLSRDVPTEDDLYEQAQKAHDRKSEVILVNFHK